MLQNLPSTLKAEILSYTHNKIFEKIRFFRNKDPQFLWAIFPLLKTLKIRANQLVYRIGDYSDEIFFILKGSIKLIDENGIYFKSYSEGTYFGDLEILNNVK